MSPEQKSEYIEQKQYEAEDRRNRIHDKLRAQKAACSEYGYIWVVQGKGFTGFDRRRMKKDPYWFPKHAGPMDFGCISQRDLMIEMRRAGYYWIHSPY